MKKILNYVLCVVCFFNCLDAATVLVMLKLGVKYQYQYLFAPPELIFFSLCFSIVMLIYSIVHIVIRKILKVNLAKYDCLIFILSFFCIAFWLLYLSNQW